MITTRTAPRTRRFLAAAVILSVAIHLFGGAIWARATQFVARVMHRLPDQHQAEQEVATSDVVHLEKRTVPRPAQRSRAKPMRPPVSRPNRDANPQAARVAVVAQPKAAEPAHQRMSPVPQARPEIAHRAPHAPLHAPKTASARVPGAGAPPAARRQRATLTASQLAALNAQFSKTIASSRVDLATIQKRIAERPVAIKRSPLQFTGAEANLQRGQGYITPTTLGRRVGGSVYYYTHYTYMWPDGHIEDDDIPWPFHFPVSHDLFALRVHLIPLQLPPPGFHLDRPLKPFLAHFVHAAQAG